MTSLLVASWTNRPPLNALRRALRSARRSAGRTGQSSDAGMTTAEYAVGTVAAVAFAVVLYKVVRSPEVQSALSSIVRGALSVSVG
ncbi:MAG: DUF4244 domain-containing protein [Actinobacteria bacterium]|nr:DUF4244 domain-containing protein [Actinomycetota bacterium]